MSTFNFELGTTAALMAGLAAVAAVASVVASRAGSKVILTILLWLSAALTVVVLVAVVIILGRIGDGPSQDAGKAAVETRVDAGCAASNVASSVVSANCKTSRPVGAGNRIDVQATPSALPERPIVIYVNPATSEAKPGPDGGEPTTAVMNAVALVVAVVTLLLSLGTTWLSTQMTRVQELTQQLNGQIGIAGLREQAAEALIEAKKAILDWVSANSAKPADQAIEWGLRLEMLTSAMPLTRFRAFHELQVLRAMPDDMQVPVARYAKVCDELLSKRPAPILHNVKTLTEVDQRIHSGRWCNLFDIEEHARYEAIMRLLSKSSSVL